MVLLTVLLLKWCVLLLLYWCFRYIVVLLTVLLLRVRVADVVRVFTL